MTCQPCADAERDPTRNDFNNRCMSCKARAFASLGNHVESERLGTITPRYRTELERIFGDDWKAGHEMVKAWGKKVDAVWRRSKGPQ